MIDPIYTNITPALDIWSTLTSHKMLFLYTAVLTAALIILMVLFIARTARAARERDEEKKRITQKKRFSRLSELDSRNPGENAQSYDDTVSLAQLCERFRDFSSGELGLYYDIDVMRAFVSSLSVTRLVIMQGISGTGKTSLAYAFGKFIGTDAVIVPVQPSWKDRSDLLGYYNEFTGVFTETELLYRLYEAAGNDNVCVLVLDEMNIARVEYYFAEFLSLLELPDPDSRRIEVISDTRVNDPKRFENGKMLIPRNVWFVGTANNDDSTLAISDKVYDRAMVIELDCRAKSFTAPRTKAVPVSRTYLESLFASARAEHSLSSGMQSKIEEFDRYLSEHMQITFGNRIMRQTEQFVPVFIACGGTENAAVDLIMSKKVLRKLETQNPVFVKSQAEGLLAELDRVFGAGALPLCASAIARYVSA